MLYLTYEEVMKILDKLDQEYIQLINENKMGSERIGSSGRIQLSRLRKEITHFTKKKYGIENK